MLRILAKKGVYDILLYIQNYNGLHYNDVLNYAMHNHLFKSRATVTTILNDLTAYHLLDKENTTKPNRTCYKVNEKGHKMIKCLEKIKKIIK